MAPLRMALDAAPETRLPMASPITRWMTAWATAMLEVGAE